MNLKKRSREQYFVAGTFYERYGKISPKKFSYQKIT